MEKFVLCLCVLCISCDAVAWLFSWQYKESKSEMKTNEYLQYIYEGSNFYLCRGKAP